MNTITESKEILFQGKKVHYACYGKGSPVMLIHGFTEDSNVWNPLIPTLSSTHLLIVPDLPGSGRSQMLENVTDGLNTYADCIKAILEAEGLNACTMIGHSMGGYISLAFHEKYPLMLTALALFHSSAYADDEAKVEARKKSIDFINNNGVEAFLKTGVPALFKDAEVSKSDIETLLQEGLYFKRAALVQYLESMMNRPDRTQLLKEMQIPVLFIAGEFDKAVPKEHSLEQSHMPQHSYIHILRNSAHMGMFEETAASIEILANFLHKR